MGLDWFSFEVECDFVTAVELDDGVLLYPVVHVQPSWPVVASPLHCQEIFSNIQIIILYIDGLVWASANALPAKIAVWHMVPDSHVDRPVRR
jgi:hypothetical protein